MHFLGNEVKAKWIEDFVEAVIAVAWMRLQDAQTAIMQQLNDMTSGENVGETTGMPEPTCDEMLNAFCDSLRML
jgi:hypothetical protein